MAKIMNLVDSKMLEQMRAPVNPLHRTLSALDSEMQSILQRSDMSDEDKVQAYNQILQRYLEYQKTDKKPSQTILEVNNPKIDIEREVMRTVPKTLRSKATSLLERIREDPNTSWNDRGEFVYKGQPVAGSNIVDLVNDMMRFRKKFLPHGRYDFARALRHSHIPQELVGNDRVWSWMHRQSASSDAFSTADETLDDETFDDDRSRSMLKTPRYSQSHSPKRSVRKRKYPAPREKKKIYWHSLK